MEIKKCTGKDSCGLIKPLDEFAFHPGSKDGHTGNCKVCRALYQKRRLHAISKGTWHIKKEPNRQISEENKNFFRLGVMKGGDQCRDLQKALNIQIKANRALLQVIVDADQRDAHRPRTPE